MIKGKNLKPSVEPKAEARPRLPTIKHDGDGKVVLEGTVENYAAISQAMGNTSLDFQSYVLTQVLNIMGGADPDMTGRGNAALAVMSAVQPTNELEALLAAQMVGSHHLAMLAQSRAARAEDLPRMEAHSNMANKFSRTFAMQMEALSKLRRGGEQVVRHVHVNEGGQALIAGTVNTGGVK